MADNRIIRIAMSDSGSVAQAIALTDAEVVAKTEAGPNDLVQTGVGSTYLSSICHDYSGNLYATDYLQHCVVKISEGGQVSLVAGLPGTSGDNSSLMNVPALDARFNSPEGIVCDKSGTLYVCDKGNHQIRTIRGGLVSSLAGAAGVAGRVDGVAMDSRFNGPTDVCVSKSGDIFVADEGNNIIRRIRDGQVLTIAGDYVNGAAGDAENVQCDITVPTFSSPWNVSVDPEGNVYVIDYDNNKIKKITPNGWIYLFSGSGTPGRSLGTSPYYSYTCTYNALYDIDPDESGNMYVLDYSAVSGSRVLRLDYNGRPFEIHDLNGSAYNDEVYGLCTSPGQKTFVILRSA